MFCTNCGSQVPDGQKFCTNCGAALQPTEQASQPSQAEDSSSIKETTQVAENPTQNMPALQQSVPQQPDSQTQNHPSIPTSPQMPPKRNKRKMIIAIVIVVILILGGVGTAAYFTHGFGLLNKQENAEQTINDTSKSDSDDSSKSDSGDSSKSNIKKNEKDTKEKPTVKVSDVSFETVQAFGPSGKSLSDVYAVKGTIENTTDKYVNASPSFVFKISYKDKYGDEQSGEANLSSDMETPDGFKDEKIFLAPHEKKEFTYYINDTFVNPDDPSKQTPDAKFQLTNTKNSGSIPDLSLAKETVTVDSIELKACPFEEITDKILTPEEANASLSYNFDDFNAKITGTVTNTTKDKWSSASVYYYTEMDGYYVMSGYYVFESLTGSATASFVKPGASADCKGSAGYTSKDHTYEAKPIAVTYQVDKN